MNTKEKIIGILENHTKYTLIDRNMFRLIADEILALIKERKPIEDRSAEIIFNDGMDD